MMLDKELISQLQLLKHRLEKQKKEKIEWNVVITELLAAREERDELQKALLGKKVVKKTVVEQICPECESKKAKQKGWMGRKEQDVQEVQEVRGERKVRKEQEVQEVRGQQKVRKVLEVRGVQKVHRKEPSRYIPAEVKKIMRVRYGEICAVPACQKPAEQYHHTKRFALSSDHDPKYLVTLCKAHHDLAHAGLIEHEQEDPEKWKIRERRDLLGRRGGLIRK